MSSKVSNIDHYLHGCDTCGTIRKKRCPGNFHDGVCSKCRDLGIPCVVGKPAWLRDEGQVQEFRRRIRPNTMARRSQDRGPSNPAARHLQTQPSASSPSSSSSTNVPSITPSSQSVVVDGNPILQEAIGGYPATGSSVSNNGTAFDIPTSPPDIPPPSTTSDTEIVGLLSSLSFSHLPGMQRVVIEVDDLETFQALCVHVGSWNSMLLGMNAEPLRVHPVLSPRTQLPSI